MSRYFHQCPRCLDLQPVRILNLLHVRGPACVCRDCGEGGCTQCMPHDLCDACQEERIDAEEDERRAAFAADYGDDDLDPDGDNLDDGEG